MARHRKYINKRGAFILERNQFGRVETYSVPKDEYEWVTSHKKLVELISWYSFYGLMRAYPHPMGKDLAELYDQYAQEMASKGQPYFFDNPYREEGTE